MKERSIAALIVISLILGVVVGAFLNDPQWSAAKMQLSDHKHATILFMCRFIGLSVFLAALKVLIVPLVASTVFVAVARIGTAHMGRLGVSSLIYYFVTMLIAVFSGMALVVFLAPGSSASAMLVPDVSIETPEAVSRGAFGILENIVSLLVPNNVLSAMVQGQTLSVICFFIFFGIVTALLEEKAKLLIEIGEQVSEVLLRMVFIVLYLAPMGVFCLIVDSVAQHGLSMFSSVLSGYILCVVLGLSFHALVVLPLIYLFLAKKNPINYFLAVKSALMMAFGTASSSATLPVSLRVAREAGVNQKVSGVVLPLGSTVNMDGTALYEAVAVIFLAQLSGVELGAIQLIVVAFTATLAAVGAAGIPSAGLVTLFIVIDAVNSSLLSIDPKTTIISVSAVGLILGVDRILDMFRTSVNVWGDLVGAAVIESRTSLT